MRFFTPNIGSKGRLIRAGIAVLLLALAAGLWCAYGWPGAIPGGVGVFMLYEALRGWCVLRACRIRTKY